MHMLCRICRNPAQVALTPEPQPLPPKTLAGPAGSREEGICHLVAQADPLLASASWQLTQFQPQGVPGK